MQKKQIDRAEAIMELTAMIDDWAFQGAISEKEADRVDELLEAII